MEETERASPVRPAAGPVSCCRVTIAPEGLPFVLAPLAAAVGLAVTGWRAAALAPLGLAGFMAFFFRDPDRHPPIADGAILAPADGRVTEVREEVTDPFVGAARQVSIFLSPLDVHVNRAAIGGRVVSVDYRPGGFRPAYQPEAADNEQSVIALEGPGGRVVMRQIAGVLARRIVCRVRPGDRLAAGERFGMIKFGSRMDVVMEARSRLRVGVGDRVRAGETVLAVVG
jgi:phosphatidylserine decarboxylase